MLDFTSPPFQQREGAEVLSSYGSSLQRSSSSDQPSLVQARPNIYTISGESSITGCISTRPCLIVVLWFRARHEPCVTIEDCNYNTLKIPIVVVLCVDSILCSFMERELDRFWRSRLVWHWVLFSFSRMVNR
jgi:hypothetical protein